jgi:uncharacterized protein YllA (UPF0747 family)
MLESVVNTLGRNVLPHVKNAKALQDAEMCVAVLKCAGRLVPTEQQLFAQEIREMSDLFAALGHLWETDRSPEGLRMQERGRTLKAYRTLETPAYKELLRRHRELSQALIPALDDLHALESQGHAIAAQGLATIRAHLLCRSSRDLEVYLGAPAAGAMVGRDS